MFAARRQGFLTPHYAERGKMRAGSAAVFLVSVRDQQTGGPFPSELCRLHREFLSAFFPSWSCSFVGVYEFTNFEMIRHEQLRGRGLPGAVGAANDDDFVHVP
jgi:hypothetical protein